jgi:hypothetical protein
MSHLIERFHAAVRALLGEGPVKQRLAKAYSDHLEDLQGLELPLTDNGTFAELHAALHRVAPVGKETCVKASVQKMSSSEAQGHAETIVRLYAELVARRGEPLKVVEPLVKAPPRFLAG